MTETAAPKSTDTYTWYTYRAARGINLTTTNGKRSVMLRTGSTFGLRPASKKDEYRLITEELGPTIVFTLSAADNRRMIQRGAPKRSYRPPQTQRTPSAKAVPQRTRVREETTAAATRRVSADKFASAVNALGVKQARNYLQWLAEQNTAPTAATLSRWQRTQR